ncbi:hypothetical protein KCU93_g163, partial [Aureobasidium melanogenum]
MAAESDSPKHLQPLDLIFSCNICHDSISDIPSPPPDEKELEGIRKPVAKLWMTECAHLICAKHLEGGAPPFHPAGQAPRAVCPVCVNRQNNRALKQMYAVNGFSKGQHDSEIPQHFFQCPPVALDSKEGGMDALRFQFLGLVTYGIAVATKYRNLQTAHSHLKDQTDRMKLEKTEAETEIQTLTERITLAEEAERRYKAKEPEIKHYLEQFALVKKELDRRNEDLSALGYPPPRIDYTFPPSRLFEDDTSNGRATTSHTGPSERADRADPRIIEDHIPSVSSTTLRADSSRTYTEDDIQGIGNKRQKIADYRYIPQNMQSPSRDFSAQKRPGIRLPPASSITQKVPSRSTHFQPPSVPYQSTNSQFTFVNRSDDVRAGPQAMDTQHETWEPWGRTEANRKPDTPPYMSGALQSDGSDFTKPAAPFRPPKQQKRKIQPVDSIDDVSSSMTLEEMSILYHATASTTFSRNASRLSSTPIIRAIACAKHPTKGKSVTISCTTSSKRRFSTTSRSISVTSPFFRADQGHDAKFQDGSPSETWIGDPSLERFKWVICEARHAPEFNANVPSLASSINIPRERKGPKWGSSPALDAACGDEVPALDIYLGVGRWAIYPVRLNGQTELPTFVTAWYLTPPTRS